VADAVVIGSKLIQLLEDQPRDTVTRDFLQGIRGRHGPKLPARDPKRFGFIMAAGPVARYTATGPAGPAGF
jgi:hypothetical protein